MFPYFLFPYLSSSIEKTSPFVFLFLYFLTSSSFLYGSQWKSFFLFHNFSFFIAIHIVVGNLEYISNIKYINVCVCVYSKLETKKNINWNVCVNIYFSYNMCVCVYHIHTHDNTFYLCFLISYYTSIFNCCMIFDIRFESSYYLISLVLKNKESSHHQIVIRDHD